MLSGASQEYKAAVIMHEIIHTSLTVNNLSNANAGIYPPSGYQHYQMLIGYTDEMVLALTNFFPDLTLEQAKSLALDGLGSVVRATPEFDALVTRWGFNNITNSTQNWAYFLRKHEVGEKGTPCNSSRGGNSNTGLD